MRVRQLMIEKPITVSDRASVQEAIHLMEENGIRHLPVINKAKRLAGWVTLGDMKQGFLPAVVTGLSVADLMVKDPITTHPDADVEAAAQTIFQNKIGGMPVVNGNKRVVGVITVTDILGAFIKIMGILTDGSRMEVEMGEDAKAFEDVSRLIRDHGGEIVSVGIVPDEEDKKIFYFRLKECDLAPIVKALNKNGYHVRSSD